ncbi:DUF4267 domain-containing protein [Nonomuraea sp. NPDC050556]|uniref:DUF4267 domain-containing protein n=1 Tax=Nonomuraea sp. NPDC050556 TaxID=3364369 RepID=UPI0037AD5F16
MIAYGLAIVLNLFVVYMGAQFFLRPEAAVAGYGVPSKQSVYVTIKGLRDLSYGILGLALIAFADARAVAIFMLVVAINPLGDTLIVLRNGGTKATAFGIHFSTAVIVLIDAVLLFLV